jgi:hypothetical protein
MPYFEPSWPMPLSFMPPNGAISVEMRPSLMPTLPYSRSSARRQMRPMSCLWRPPPSPYPAKREGKGGGVSLAILTGLVVGLEAVERRGRAECPPP